MLKILAALVCALTVGQADAALRMNQTTAPTVTISAAPTNITLGSSTTITWSTTNATSCTASSSPSSSWSGSVATSGSQSVTPGTAATYTFTLTCTGPGGTTPNNTSVMVNASGAQTFPSLGMYAIQDNHDYDTTAVLQREAISDIVIMNMWDGWRDPNTGRNGLQTLQDLAAITTRGTKAIGYFIPTISDDYAAYSAWLNTINAANFWLRNPYPSGPQVSDSNVGGSGYWLSYVSGGPTYSSGTPAVARTYNQYMPDYVADFYWFGGSKGLATNGTQPNNTLWAGFYQDSLFTNCGSGILADYERTGTSGYGYPPDCMSGQVAQSQRLQSDTSGTLAFGNISDLVFSQSAATTNYGSGAGYPFDGGDLENMFGGGCSSLVGGYANSVECTQSTSGYVQFYQFQMSLLGTQQLGVFTAYNITSNGEDAYDTTHPYQAWRAGFTSCIVLGNARCDFQASGSPNLDNNATLWFDEDAVNVTTQNPCTTPTTACGAYVGYLGTATDPPQTAAYQGCYWRRRFQYGEVWWSPKDCPAGTINFGHTVRFINGGQAPSFNTGGSGTTHSIGERDGIVVLFP